MIRGDKFSVKAVLDVEILGFFPAGQTNDGKAKYVCTVNGYKITTEAGFLEMLKNIEKTEETKAEEAKVEEVTEKVKQPEIEKETEVKKEIKTEKKKGGTKNGRKK